MYISYMRLAAEGNVGYLCTNSLSFYPFSKGLKTRKKTSKCDGHCHKTNVSTRTFGVKFTQSCNSKNGKSNNSDNTDSCCRAGSYGTPWKPDCRAFLISSFTIVILGYLILAMIIRRICAISLRLSHRNIFWQLITTIFTHCRSPWGMSIWNPTLKSRNLALSPAVLVEGSHDCWAGFYYGN